MTRQHSISQWSPIATIKGLRFYGIPKDKRIEVHAIAKHSNTTVYEGKDGRLYSPSVKYSGIMTFGRGNGDDLLRCAMILRKVSKIDIRDHFEQADAYEKAQAHRIECQRFIQKAAALVVLLTKTQMKKLA